MMSNDLFLTIANRVQWCWLSTITDTGRPNVSPKEYFIVLNTTQMIIANVASTYVEDNIANNNNICLAFIDIFSQKGYKLVGTAQIIDNYNQNYQIYKNNLEHLMISKNIGPKGYDPIVPIKNIFLINIESIYELKSPKPWR